MFARPYLLTTPVEIIEYILTLLAADEEPHAIAALAATCRLLYDMVYRSLDSHLWREIFLTTFDDPRPARRLTYRRAYTMPFGHMERTDDIHLQNKSPSTGAYSTDIVSGPPDTSSHSTLQTQILPYHVTTTTPTSRSTRPRRTSGPLTQYFPHWTQQQRSPRPPICSPRARWRPSPGCSRTTLQDLALAPALAPPQYQYQYQYPQRTSSQTTPRTHHATSHGCTRSSRQRGPHAHGARGSNARPTPPGSARARARRCAGSSAR